MVAFPWTSQAFKAQTFFILSVAAAPATAQQSTDTVRDIVVSGQRSVTGIPADRIVTEDEVLTYGLSSVEELLDEIARECGNGREEIVYLIDGKRVTGLGDISTYPTEAISSIEILPRGAAAQLGGSPNQQVVNISLKPQLRSVVGRVAIAFATDGGFTSQNGEVSITDITRPRRINLALRWRSEDALVESERNVTQAPNAPADLARFRSLRPDIADYEIRGSVADELASNLNGLLTVRLFDGKTRSLLGRDGNGTQLSQRSKLDSANVDVQLNGDLGNWLLAFSGSYSQNRRRTFTDEFAATGLQSGNLIINRARIRNASGEVNATRSILGLPAGPLNLTLRGRFSRNSINVAADRFTQLTREISASVQIPISNAAGRFGPFGDLTAGIEQTYARTTRVGAITNATYSLQWQPANWFRLAGSVASGQTPPGVELTSGPLIATPGVRYLDPLQGETVDVVSLTGGNPALNAQRGTSQQISLEVRPSGDFPVVFTADYANTRNEDIITSLPAGNNQLLLAFPERFVRDGAGRLFSVDTRPLNFARQSDQQIRYGLELNVLLGENDIGATSREDRTRKNTAPENGRLRFNVSHTILLKSEVVVSSGLEPVNLLSKDAFGFSSGERPRHDVDVGAEYAARGLGVQLSGQFKGQSFINLTGGTTPNILRFSPLNTINLRAFVDGQRLIPTAMWLKGTRLSLQVVNISNTRQRVRDRDGQTPLFYQAAYRDPTGRLVQIELRKVL